MAEIQSGISPGKEKKRAKKQSTRVDMTPMVDLAFLLLTFFVLTATFSKPKSMELVFPSAGEPSHLKNGITFLLSKENRIFYYEGELRAEANNQKSTKLQELTFAQNGSQSLHAFLLSKNKNMHNQIRTLEEQHSKGQLKDTTYKRLVREAKANKNTFTYLIKTDENATYENVIDVIDELNINVVGKYVVADLMKAEQTLINEALAINK